MTLVAAQADFQDLQHSQEAGGGREGHSIAVSASSPVLPNLLNSRGTFFAKSWIGTGEE